ncbi:MAG: serine/threonine-protein kinase [Polyangiaceae bacterium]
MASLISLSPGLLIAKKFRLDREIARGGMGSVWAAFNSQLETPIAVKFMSPEGVGSPELVARFQREAKAAAQIRSPHVVQIFEHGMHGGLPFIVMELLEGEDLGARLRREERLSLPQVGEIVTQVCKALRRAHEMGIVHRDLKPANVFLARHDDDEIVKVLDFGIAKSLATSGENDDASTQTGTLVGTPHYMSPEQAQRSKLIDARSDLWSLGVIAFRALTGRVPFKGDDMINVLVKVCTEAPPVASSLAPELGPEVDAFFARALCRELDGRFQSAREMAEAFAAMLGRRSLASEISVPPFSVPPPAPSTRIPQPPPSSDAALSSPRAPVPSANPAEIAAASSIANEPATSTTAAAPTRVETAEREAMPPPAQSIPAPGTLAGAASEAVDLPTAMRPGRKRAMYVIGILAAAIAVIAAMASVGSGPSETAAAGTPPSTSVAPPPSASASVAPPPSASASVAPPPSASASAPPSTTATTTGESSATAPASATPSMASASSSSTARPASSLKGTLPRATAAPRGTGAIGGAPKF